MALQTIEFIIGSVSLLIAYIFSTMIVGKAEAQVAVHAGDDTPADAGFLSWDPFVFMDLPGFLCTILLGIGWGRQLPFNPHNVTGRHKLLSVFWVYMAQPLFAILLSLFALVINIFLAPQSLSFVFWGLTSHKNGSLFHELSTSAPEASSLLLIFVMILLAVVAFNTFTAVWSFLNNIFHYLLFVGAEHGHDYMKHAEALGFFGPLVVIILFTSLLRYVLLKYLIIAAYGIAIFLKTLTYFVVGFFGGLATLFGASV